MTPGPSLAAELAPMAGGRAGLWRLVLPMRADPLPVVDVLARLGLRVETWYPDAFDARPGAASLEAADAPGILVACLDGWEESRTVRTAIRAAAMADRAVVYLEHERT